MVRRGLQSTKRKRLKRGNMRKQVAIIGGIGTASKFSEALLKELLAEDYHVVGIARSSNEKAELISEFQNAQQSNGQNSEVVLGDLNDSQFIKSEIERLEKEIGPIAVYIHNPAQLVLKPFLECSLEEFEGSWEAMVKTAVTVCKELIPHMIEQKSGTIIFTGATASLKGNAKSAPFSSAKFALRSLSQSLAREFGPKGIHIAHVIVDGIIEGKRAQGQFNLPLEKCIKSTALAEQYVNLIKQDISCWTQELDLRPHSEVF